MTQFSYAVFHDPAGTLVNITDFVERLEWNEVGTGEVRSASVRLNSQEGQFITRATQLGTGKDTPILQQFDQVSLQITDRNSVQRDYMFEVDMLKPISNANTGTILEVELLGLENQLMKVNFTKPFLRFSGFDITRDIIDFYNDPDSKGSLQPLVTGNDNTTANGGGNDLPEFTANDYHFELTEQSAYDGLTRVGDRLGSSVQAGGGGDFFEIYFKTATNLVDIEFNGFISGNPPSQQVDNANGDFTFDAQKSVKITDTTAVNPGEEEGGTAIGKHADRTGRSAAVVARAGHPARDPAKGRLSGFFGVVHAVTVALQRP